MLFFGDPHMQLRGFGHAAAYHQLRGLENRRHVIKMRSKSWTVKRVSAGNALSKSETKTRDAMKMWTVVTF